MNAADQAGDLLKQIGNTRKILHNSKLWILAVGSVLIGCSGCRGQIASTGLEVQMEDYSKARSHFQTHLVRHEPAPQPGETLHAPAGAQQVVYSKTPSLVAWITPLQRGSQSRNSTNAGTKKPAVLFLHGGFAIGDDDWQMAQPYRDAGYIVMMPVLRGENGQTGDYSMFYDEVKDVVSAADYLAARPDVDPKHIYAAGHSVGGTLTLLAAMTTTRFRAAASFSGSPNQVEWSKSQPELIPFDPKDTREYQMRSPIAFATSFKCPVRMYYGSNETLFGTPSQRTAELAKEKKLDVEAVSVPGDHFTAVPAAMLKSIEFFQSK